ncbi:chromate transporter [Geobacter sp. FeAm09]|uniref:chromate transporter n=1 Tax=Geobacter sp. FeAm09 TaxID=2597769 RepID=UPI0011EFE746|nr:chromate transporter [Geobacter sp. FeAm09]QEM69004.1 chromate transporter [Geobacter sp. FeAm09]
MEHRREISHRELFWGFTRIALSGFGGVMAWARRAIVEERGWLSSEEFTSLFGLCQFMPGPNIVNLSVCIGARFQGASGAVVSLLGLLLAPFGIIIALGALYGRFGELPAIQAMLRGIAAVAAGLILAMGVRMAADLRKRPLLLVFSAAILGAVVFLHWPLLAVMAGLAPFSMWLAARRYYRAP